jgi:hypothetical protein
MSEKAQQMAIAALTCVEQDWLATGTIKGETADRVIAALTQMRLEWDQAKRS